MTTANSPASDTAQRDIVITRTFDAPRALVWNVWTEPEHLMRWWGPQHFTAPVCKINLRVGGEYLYCMRSPDGQDYWSTGTFREVVEPERIVCTHSFADEHGNHIPASQLGMPGNWPDEVLVSATFEEQDGGTTRVTVRETGIPVEMSEFAELGWVQQFDKLAAVLAGIPAHDGGTAMTTDRSSAMTLTLPSDCEIMLQRTFNAPRELVWEAISKPEHVRRWWGLRNSTMTVCEMDVRVGGKWRHVLLEADGSEIEFYGEYRQIAAPERLVCTETYAPFPDNPGLNTVTLEERDGGTTLTTVSRYESQEVRDMVIQSGMEYGAAETYDRLAELLATLV